MSTLHQFVTGATAGDAITNHALQLQHWLRAFGFASEIFAQHIHPSVAELVRPLAAYRRSADQRFVIYHHSIGSDVPDFLIAKAPPLVQVYHNITPPQYFERVDPNWVRLMRLGRAQLATLRPHTRLALAVSPYNEAELRQAGYPETDVLPIVLPAAAYDQPTDGPFAAQLRAHRPSLLFVGRLSPNKRQEDLVQLLVHYRRLQPNAHLTLVGDRWDVGYDRWVEKLAADYGVADGVTLTGKVSQAALVTAYRSADLFISMSEHEGFGQPLIEAMYLGLPVLAFASSGVPATLAAAGVQFLRKDFARLAELVDILVHDDALRARIVARQQNRAADFLDDAVAATFRRILRGLGMLAPGAAEGA